LPWPKDSQWPPGFRTGADRCRCGRYDQRSMGTRVLVIDNYDSVSYTHLDVYKRQVADGEPGVGGTAAHQAAPGTAGGIGHGGTRLPTGPTGVVFGWGDGRAGCVARDGRAQPPGVCAVDCGSIVDRASAWRWSRNVPVDRLTNRSSPSITVASEYATWRAMRTTSPRSR